jgi:undecaprenyl pyrophosphate phosphatase UppP
LSAFLGEYNTNENLTYWMTHFREKAKKYRNLWFWCIVAYSVWLGVRHFYHHNLSESCMSFVIVMFVLIAFGVLFPCLTNRKYPKVNGETEKMFSELLYDRIK